MNNPLKYHSKNVRPGMSFSPARSRYKLLSRDQLILSCVALFPLFVLTVKSWTNAFLFALFLLCVTSWRTLVTAWANAKSEIHSLAVMFALASNITAVCLSQLLRQDFSIRALDAPSRLLLAVPIFLVLKEKKVDFVRLFQYACPASLLLAVGSTIAFPFFHRSGRLATYFVDPITFGNFALVLGFMSFLSINVLNKDDVLSKAFKLAGFAAGIYLSLWSQTRSGWLALPILLALWLLTSRETNARAIRYGVVGAALVGAVIAYIGLDFVRFRVDDVLYSIPAWVSGENQDTSIGIRLTMWRMALVLFGQSPLYGYGDIGYANLMESHPDILAISTPLARHYMHGGPHNTVLASMLHSGVFGMVSAVSLFVLPAIVFWRAVGSTVRRQRGAGLLGLCLVLGLFVSSLGEQVLYLTFMSSFYGLMIASLCATALWREDGRKG